MPSQSIRRAVIAALLAVVFFPRAGSAQDFSSVPAGLIVPPNAPAVITSCRFGQNTIVGLASTLVIGNRTKRTMFSVDIAYSAYGTDGTKISQQTKHVNLDDVVQSGDTAVVRNSFDIDLRSVGNHLDLVGKIGCEVVGASYTGNKQWHVGERWPETMVPLQSTQMNMQQSGVGAGGARSSQAAAAPRFSLSVVNAWVDNQAGVTIEHETVAVTAGDADVTLHPQDLTLSMTLAGGARKTYYGLAHPAPQYQKTVPGVGTSMVPEVAPASDLGAIGALTIPAHSSATTTVTFLIGDVLENSADNRAVSAR